MRGVNIGRVPSGLESERRDLRADLGHLEGQKRIERARAAFNDAFRDPERKSALSGQQKGICVYCEQRLGKVTVEHWETVHAEPERALDWSNLYASCDVAERCNLFRGDRCLNFPPPSELPYEQELCWSSDGLVDVKVQCAHLSGPEREALVEALPGASRQGKGALNLNEANLVAMRKSALRGLVENWKRKGRANTRKARREEAERLESLPESPPFLSILSSFLRGEVVRPP